MKVLIDSDIVFQKKYESFDELSDEHIDHEMKQGRQVPNFNYEDWIRELVFFIFVIVAAEIQSRRDLKDAERRHEELIAKLDELEGTHKTLPSSVSSAVLDFAEENAIEIEVCTETEVEEEIWDTFQNITRSRSISVKRK